MTISGVKPVVSITTEWKHFLEKSIKQASIAKNFSGLSRTNKRLVRFNLEIERELDNYLKEKAKQNKTSKSEEIRKLILEDMQKFRSELR